MAAPESVRQLGAWPEHSGKNDILVGLSASHVWLALGWHDIRQRYRRSVIGPFWFTLSTLIMVGVLGVLYATLFQQNVREYLIYLGVGLVAWQFINSCANEGATTLISAAPMIKQIRMPLTVHVARMVWRNFVILLHSLPVILMFMLLFGYRFTTEFFLVFPALAIIFANSLWMALLISLLCARYRDVVPIVANLFQVLFFFTPVLWMEELLKERSWFADFNPFHHLIEIVRAPLVGSEIQADSWIWSVSMAIVGMTLAQMLMVKARNRVPYWV